MCQCLCFHLFQIPLALRTFEFDFLCKAAGLGLKSFSFKHCRQCCESTASKSDKSKQIIVLLRSESSASCIVFTFQAVGIQTLRCTATTTQSARHLVGYLGLKKKTGLPSGLIHSCVESYFAKSLVWDIWSQFSCARHDLHCTWECSEIYDQKYLKLDWRGLGN